MQGPYPGSRPTSAWGGPPLLYPPSGSAAWELGPPLYPSQGYYNPVRSQPADPLLGIRLVSPYLENRVVQTRLHPVVHRILSSISTAAHECGALKKEKAGHTKKFTAGTSVPVASVAGKGANTVPRIASRALHRWRAQKAGPL